MDVRRALPLARALLFWFSLTSSGAESATTWSIFLTPTELLAKGSSVYGTSVRLGGIVEEGSIRWDANSRELRFRLEDDNAHTIEVLSTGVPPQMFNGGIGAVVEGVWTPDGVFHCHNLMVKHSNEYRAPMPGNKPPAYYKELFRKQQS
jgi:cytochrome c-type biogenesis protein CcmE